MKKLLLILAFLSFHCAFAQKDLEVTLVKPDSTTPVYDGVEFSMFIQLKNVGQTDIPATDSVDIAIFVDDTIYGGTNINSHFHGLAANQSDIWEIPVALPITYLSHHANFCVMAFLYKNGVTLDANESNDKGCQWVTVSPFHVGLAKTASPSSNVKLFPVPANDVLYVSLGYNNEHKTVLTILDITGKAVATLPFENGEIAANTTSLNNGIYLFQINDHNGNLLKNGKFTITH